MNWHETIEYIQNKKEFEYLVEKSYLSKDLKRNFSEYFKSDEFSEITKILKKNFSNKKVRILDIGSGNGISAVSFAKNGHDVSAVEPDPSSIVGTQAINFLKENLGLYNLNIISTQGEKLPFKDNSFDVVFTRQCLHHASDLKKFLSEGFRVLKKNGLFISVRDHVVFNEKDKEWFLQSHPLQKYYGGENAYSVDEYVNAFTQNGFLLDSKLSHYSSVINYYPLTTKRLMFNRIGSKVINIINAIFFLNSKRTLRKLKSLFRLFEEDEMLIPGRLYSFVGRKA